MYGRMAKLYNILLYRSLEDQGQKPNSAFDYAYRDKQSTKKRKRLNFEYRFQCGRKAIKELTADNAKLAMAMLHIWDNRKKLLGSSFL